MSPSLFSPPLKVAGLEGDDDDNDDVDAAAKEQQASREGSWWARPMEELTEDEVLLGCGAAVVSTLRAAVRSELGYSCTAGESSCVGGKGTWGPRTLFCGQKLLYFVCWFFWLGRLSVL